MFDKCWTCDHMGRNCIPYLVSLSSADLLEWCRERKAILRLSNAQIAEETGIPKGTIDRLLSPGNTDFRYSTMQPVVFLLAGIRPEDLVCSTMATPEEHEETVAVLQRQVARERQIAVIRLHIIKALAISLAITLMLIIVALATDFIDPAIGYFWRTPHN